MQVEGSSNVSFSIDEPVISLTMKYLNNSIWTSVNVVFMLTDTVDEVRLIAMDTARSLPNYSDVVDVLIVHCGVILPNDFELMSWYNFKENPVVYIFSKREIDVNKSKTVSLPQLDADFCLKVFLNLQHSVTKVCFSKAVKQFVAPESIAKFCPDIKSDPMAHSFIASPELLRSLSDMDSFNQVAKQHPILIVAIAKLCLNMKTEHVKSPSLLERVGMTEDVDEMESDSVESSRGNTHNVISINDLATAVSLAQANLSSTITSSAITSEMMQRAVDGAMNDMPGTSGRSASNTNAQSVARMLEMGVDNPALAERALEIMQGDVNAAVELIFHGWTGT